MSRQQTTRRQVLKTGALAAAATLVPHTGPLTLAADVSKEKLNLGIIGSGGRGGSNLNSVKSENIYALCDVNGPVLDSAHNRFPKAKKFFDWRELIQDPKIDGVVISTADHHHALAAIAAMQAGKHVYCEKPLAHTVHEARTMQNEYIKRRDSISTQMGTQIHATGNYRRLVELVRAGAIGQVREAHVWCSRSIKAVGENVLASPEKPKDFDWDVWLGPASDRDYNQGYWKGGNLNWNRRWEFGNGVLGDMGSHLIDLPFWALDLKRPTSIQANGPKADDIACPPWQEITWEHAARKGDYLDVPVKVIWYHGPEGMKRRSDALQAKLGKDTDLRKWSIGIAFVGDDGLLVGDYGKHLLSPRAKFDGNKPSVQSIAPSLGHHREWLHACKTGEPTLCNFDYSGALIEHNLLGNVAYRAGKTLQWDAESMKITNAPEAEKLLTKEYRDGWKIKTS